MIVALGRNNEIGCENRLIWPIREDLKHFKALTTGHPVIMGRKTWESLPKRPLPGRTNVVITRQKDYQAPGACVAGSLQEALEMIADSGTFPFIIGGASLYAEALPGAARLHLTRIDADAPQADTWFPAIDGNIWEMEESSDPMEAILPGEQEPVSYRFETLRNITLGSKQE